MSEKHYIGCDLGAESGRVILGSLAEGKLSLEEMHRFPTGASKINDTLRWDIVRIFEELKTGLRKVAAKGVDAESLSVDSWGVDYVLFNDQQPILSQPFHYRDARADRAYAHAFDTLSKETIFAETGIQFMSLNTLYHFMAEVAENDKILSIADQFLTIADFLNFLFSGVAKNEVSSASTTQIMNTATQQWSQKLIDGIGFPKQLFPEIIPSATKLGPLVEGVQSETGLSGVEVVATCSHDTGAAVAAVPAEGEGWAYLSSGTWSLIGVELPEPLINETVCEANFTNEAGYGGTTRFLKNIVGLWIQQESRRAWAEGGQQFSYPEIDEMAIAAEPLRSLIHPNAARFVKPERMPSKVSEYCRESGQLVPETPGQISRCILESLPLLYRQTLDDLERLTGRNIDRLHVVGGGSNSALLNQFTANATGRTVYAGPVEATAIGNVLLQAVALGDLDCLESLRTVVRESCAIKIYQPQDQVLWEEAFARFSKFDLMT